MNQPIEPKSGMHGSEQADQKIVEQALNRIDRSERIAWAVTAFLVMVIAAVVLWLRLTLPPSLSVDPHTVFFYTGKLITASTLMLTAVGGCMLMALLIEIRREVRLILRAIQEVFKQKSL